MDETIYVLLKIQFYFALEVWFSIYAMNRPDITAPNFIGNFIDRKRGFKVDLVGTSNYPELCSIYLGFSGSTPNACVSTYLF